MTYSRLQEQVSRYYTNKVVEHGASARGVDWNSAESQQLRFAQLLRVCGSDAGTLLDYGCGYGALYDYVMELGLPLDYRGFDCAPRMIAEARAAHPAAAGMFADDETDLQAADFVVASGILNVKLETPDDEWHAYMVAVVDRLAALSRRGFAFNALTSYSDRDQQRPHLHYADPRQWFDHCKRRIAPAVALLHDYPLWEFTILVRY